MFVPFDDLSDDSRIWIYQSHRALSDEEVNQVKKLAQAFVEGWTAHQQTLHAGFEIFHNIFLVLAIDEKQNDASGCSIDKSVHFIRQLENKFQISLLDRFNIGFRYAGKVLVKPLDDFLKMYKDKMLTDSLPVFNTLVIKKADLKTNWETPLRNTWLVERIS